MTNFFAAAIAALALSQAGPPAEGTTPTATPPPEAPRLPGLPNGPVPRDAPMLRADQPVRCLYGPSGTFRAQCDEAARRCLVAPDAMLDAEGQPAGPLERTSPCTAPAIREADLAGWTVVPARADVEPGYLRDGRQRASQVAFDLDRRLWLGAGFAAGGQPWQPGPVASSGIRLDVPFSWAGAAAMARVHALEGWTAMDGHAAALTGLAVDLSRAYPRPLVWLTTFVGEPRRIDLPLDLGLWARVLEVESLRTRAGDRFERTGAAAGGVTLDLWRSADFASSLRLKLGAGTEKASHRHDSDWAVTTLVEGEGRLDAAGLTWLRGAAGTELVLPNGAGPDAPLPDRRWRHVARAEVERVVFSVNDQPVSAVLGVRAGKRTDVPDWPTGWTAEATAELRVSLWAPPPRPAPSKGATRP